MVEKARIIDFKEKFRSDRDFKKGGPLDGGGGGPHDPGMENRVTRLEAQFEHVVRDLDEIKADVKGLASRFDKLAENMATLPTRRDLTTNLQWIIATTFGVCFAVVSIFVGVLAYLQDRQVASSAAPSSQPSPIIIQLPQMATPAPITAPPPAPEHK